MSNIDLEICHDRMVKQHHELDRIITKLEREAGPPWRNVDLLILLSDLRRLRWNIGRALYPTDTHTVDPPEDMLQIDLEEVINASQD